MPKCGHCKHWFIEGQFRRHEGYWYCEKYDDYEFDPQNEACKYFEPK